MPIAPVFLHFGWAFGGTEFFLICDYKGISSSEEWQKKPYYKNTPYCTPPFEVAQRFKAVNIGAIALFASRNIMSCLEKCPYNHRKAKF